MMKHISKIVLAMLILLFFCINVHSAVEIVLEAELANKIVQPMVIGVPADAKANGGPEPDEPSSGKFIWAPGAPASSSGRDHQGYAEFVVNIPKRGKYTIWGRVIAWDGNSDSFWVVWLPADPDVNPQQTQDQNYRWAVEQGVTWHWDRVNKWLDAGVFDREWELDKGESILRIYTREDATMLDCLYITDDLAAPVPRLPTKEDIDAQIRGKTKLAVDTKHKLCTAWAMLKSY